MSDRLQTRRNVLRTTGAALVGGAVLGGTGVGTAAGATSDHLEEQLATAREATAKYTDPAAALQDGYRPVGPNVPAMGWHFINQDLLKDAAENGPSIESPAALTYADTGDHLVLGSAEYSVPVPNPSGFTGESPPDLFAGDGLTVGEGSGDGGGHEDESGGGHDHGSGGRWHVHPSAQHLYADASGSRTDPSDISMGDLLTEGRWTEVPVGDSLVEPGETVEADWGLTGTTEQRVVDLAPQPHPNLLSLHAWVHTENPHGVFAASNPNVEFVERLPDEFMAAMDAGAPEPSR